MKELHQDAIPRSALKRVPRILGASVLMAALAICAAPAWSQNQGTTTTTPIQLMSPAERAQLEQLLTDQLQLEANLKRRFETQTKPLRLQAKFDLSTGDLTIDIGEEYGRLARGAEMEDLGEQLINTSIELLRDIAPRAGVMFLYGGKNRDFYFPEEWQAPRPYPSKKQSSGLKTPNGTNVPTPIGPFLPFPEDLPLPDASERVVVSAGHGLYYNYQYKDWRAQRDPSNGITEDFVTPQFADELATWLDRRSHVKVNLARSMGNGLHPPSGKPWLQVSARYHLEVLYPNNPEVWHSLPQATDSLRERNEDINSRPLFANLISARALLHIHTNADDKVATTGTRAFFQKGRADDELLANSVLCYMGEIVHAQPSYKAYSVNSQATPSDLYGENKLAKMPSVIIEVGFHTNPSDALALQDPAFRTAAMKGVEKGYRLYGQGKTCEPFAITNIPEKSTPIGVPFDIEINFKGYPQFPVKRSTAVVSCPSGWVCSGSETLISSQTDGPIRVTQTCTGPTSVPNASFVERTTLTDADGVSTSLEHRFTCTGTKGASSSSSGGNNLLL